MKTTWLFLLVLLFGRIHAGKPPRHEFRGAWVATVNNIDWPSKPGLSPDEQKKEAISLLDLLERNKINAVIMQVRPCSDSFYPSELEPWSEYLTGTPGKAPNPFYDPLKFWIEECHKRCMEFHAWLNPFRVSQNAAEPLAASHVAFAHPEWIINYGGKLYFDPGIPEVREFLVRVVADIVSRYDIDAIHFDDYFYPYPLKEQFPDENSFAKYNRGFSLSEKADWRRANVDLTIRQLSETIKKLKPWVKFGISPFGVWRNKSDDSRGSATKAGTTNYDHLYADVLKWLQNGWIDYCLPQLYWQIGHPSVDFLTLARWWSQHSFGRSMYIGHALYKLEPNAAAPEWRDANQLTSQIQIARADRAIGGSAFYSSIHFRRNLLGFDRILQEQLYKYPALIPPMPWVDSKPPERPVKFKKRGHRLKWKAAKSANEMDKSKRFVVYLNPEGKKFDQENPENIFTITASESIVFKPNSRKLQRKFEVRISAIDRLNNESELTKLKTIKL